MKVRSLHPELRRAFRLIPSLPLHNPVFYRCIDLLQKLRSRKIKAVDGVDIHDQPLGQGAVRIYRPQNAGSGAAVLWIHGGGYIIGDVSINDRECIALVKAMSLVVVSVEYRLAPRHPFPAALDDCYEAWRFMHTSAGDLAIDPERIAVAGQSAGGGLAASLSQRITDAGGVQPAAQILIYPMLDDRTALNTELDGVKHPLWNNKNNRGGWSWYLGRAPGQEGLPPYAVPARREDLSGLPPAWLGVGDLDLFYREDCEYAERLRTAGVSCELHIVPQAPHAFDMIVPESSISREFEEGYYRFLSDRLRL